MLTPPAHFIVASAVAAISLHDKMFEFLKAHQLNAMLFMSGICAVLTILTFLTTTLSPKRKRIIAVLELAAMVLLLADRFAYIYRGNVSELGFWMVRICNFLVYFNTLFILSLIHI